MYPVFLKSFIDVLDQKTFWLDDLCCLWDDNQIAKSLAKAKASSIQVIESMVDYFLNETIITGYSIFLWLQSRLKRLATF